VFGDVASGAMQLGDVIFGVAQLEAGAVAIDGVRVKNPTQAVRQLALGYVPADRRDALALTLSAATNVTAAHLHTLFGPTVNGSRERRLAGGLLKQLRVKNCTPTSRPGTLSGGNQQKLLLARWLLRPPSVLVLVEPTRGMDLGAKAEVTRLVRQAAAEHGMAVLIVSAEPETVLSTADRIYVMAQGRVVHHFAGCEVSSRTLMAAAHGQIEMELV
jgi:ribose transport system ATP-binding protein